MNRIVDGIELFPIKGYEGLYEVSKCGKVRSLNRTVKSGDHFISVKGRWLKPAMEKGKYPRLDFKIGGKRVVELVHCVMFRTFVGEVLEGFRIDHINRIRHDNRLENLRLVDQSQHIMNQGLRCDNASGVRGIYKNKDKWVVNIKAYGQKFTKGGFTSKLDAARAYALASSILHKEYGNAAISD